MSEQDILNPSATSLLNFDYGYFEGLPEMRSLFQAASGKRYSRRQFGLGRRYELAWIGRDKATKHTLQQWAQQFENDFFSLADWERGRYFSGCFEGPLIFNPIGNEKWNIKGVFTELPGLIMFQYPSNYARDAIFIEERNGFGENLVKLTGTWAYQTDATYNHGGAQYVSSTTNDTAEWQYFGYGFVLWSRKWTDQGIVEVKMTRVRDGLQIGSLAQVDLYAAVPAISAAVYSTQNQNPLDFYRIKLRVTGTKNASSTGFDCGADAIQVMQ